MVTDVAEITLDKVFPQPVVARKKRGSAELIMAMLVAASAGAKKTHIMFRSNVNPLVLEKYIKFCLNNSLLIKEGNIYKTTEKGKRFIACLQKIDELKQDLSEAETKARELIT